MIVPLIIFRTINTVLAIHPGFADMSLAYPLTPINIIRILSITSPKLQSTLPDTAGDSFESLCPVRARDIIKLMLVIILGAIVLLAPLLRPVRVAKWFSKERLEGGDARSYDTDILSEPAK